MDWEELIKSGEQSELVMAYEQAVGYYTQAMRTSEGHYHGARRMAALRLKTGDVQESIHYNRLTIEANPSDYLAASSLLYGQQCLSESRPEEIFQSHQEWARTFTTDLQQYRPRPQQPTQGRRRKIGFISPDFFSRHPILYFFRPILEHLSRENFSIYLYSCCEYPDEVTRSILAQADIARQFSPQTLPEASLQIYRDDLDLLIDLAGHSSNHTLMVLGTKPCRRQATYLGYPNTTGLNQVDYRLVDDWSDPVGMTEKWNSEELIRLPECAWCYRPEMVEEFDFTPPSSRSGILTFGCFNNLAKLSQLTVSVWKSILEALPHARLLIKAGAFVEEASRKRIFDRLRHQQLPMDRIVLQPSMPYLDHLRFYREIDIALDTYPYHGTTTTCEALWMGVPVVSLEGPTHISRVGCSLLRQAGLEELIARDPEGYLHLAVDLANDPARLASYHLSLRERLNKSRLLQPTRFLKDFEKVLLELTD